MSETRRRRICRTLVFGRPRLICRDSITAATAERKDIRSFVLYSSISARSWNLAASETRCALCSDVGAPALRRGVAGQSIPQRATSVIQLPVGKELGRFSVRHVYPGQGHRLLLALGRWYNLPAFVEHDTVVVPIQDTVQAQCSRMISLENALHSTDRSEDTAVAALEVHRGP